MEKELKLVSFIFARVVSIRAENVDVLDVLVQFCQRLRLVEVQPVEIRVRVVPLLALVLSVVFSHGPISVPGGGVER